MKSQTGQYFLKCSDKLQKGVHKDQFSTRNALLNF